MCKMRCSQRKKKHTNRAHFLNIGPYFCIEAEPIISYILSDPAEDRTHLLLNCISVTQTELKGNL